MMDEDICDMMETLGVIIDPSDFEELLAEYGYMIVPIEDPTNLRFGVDE